MATTTGMSIQKGEVHHDFLGYLKNFYSKDEDGDYFSGTKDTVDSAVAGLKWSQYFNSSESWTKFSNNAVNSLDPLSQGLAIPALFKRANDLRHHVANWGSTDDWEINRKVFNSAALTANSGSETLMFFDSINVLPLKNWMNVLKGIFWGTAFSLDFVDFFSNVSIADNYYEKIQEAKDPEVKSFFEAKLDFTFLKIVQNISTIALATLMLVSIFFASIAEGFLFSPITLGLTTIWLALNIFTFFYEQILHTREKNFLPGVLHKV